jgi:hypothetical protein
VGVVAKGFRSFERREAAGLGVVGWIIGFLASVDT